jgi:DNA-binding Lrp family transcriptional regulator|tara:strand:- start:20074 stop:20721 length:648 start_codon:yes stop_codon:yes gene_type:complete
VELYKVIELSDTFLDKILGDCSEYLQDYEVLAITKTYNARIFPKSFLDFKEKKLKIKNEKVKIDDKDKKVLSILSDEAILPYYSTAKKIKLSHDATSYRIKKMIEGGIILKFVPVINYASINYNVYCILLRMNGLNNDKENTLKQFLSMNKNVLWSVKCVGIYNVLIYLCVDNAEKIHDTLTGLRRHFPESIINYESLIAYEEYKYTYFPDYGFI